MVMIELDQAHGRMIGLLEPIVILVGYAPQDGEFVKLQPVLGQLLHCCNMMMLRSRHRVSLGLEPEGREIVWTAAGPRGFYLRVRWALRGGRCRETRVEGCAVRCCFDGHADVVRTGKVRGNLRWHLKLTEMEHWRSFELLLLFLVFVEGR